MTVRRWVLGLSLGVLGLAMEAPAESKAGDREPRTARNAPAVKVLPATLSSIPVCYDFGCSTRDVVSISHDEWQGVAGWFYPAPASAAHERDRIRQAVGWIEVLIGQRTPTHRDTGLNLEQGGQFPGQMDCIDESLNTTVYLRLLEAEGLLSWHRVVERAHRRAIFDQHYAGQIEELASGERYVVDSWFQDNGIMPYVQSTEQWKDIPFFFTSLRDNSPD